MMMAYSPASFREVAGAFQQSRALLTAVELDLFSALAGGPRSAPEVAAARGTDPRATGRLLNVLVALDLVEKADGRFANGPFAARHLVRGRPEFMAGLMHTVNMWTRWSTLTEAVRRGTAVDAGTDPGDDWREAFMAAMHWRGRPQAEALAAALDLDGVSRVLDVAGGTGVFSMAFARARPRLRAVVFDLPAIVPITARYVAEAGLSDRVTAVAGDVMADDLPGGFDLVLLSAILHSFPPDENRRLFGKAARALALGGRVVVSEFLVNEDRTGPLQPALFALNMLVGTPAGDTYTESEIRGWMEDAGLTAVTHTDTEFGTTLMVGEKEVRSEK